MTKIIAINEIIMDDFTTKWTVNVLFDKEPKLMIGECKIKQ